MKVIPSDMIWMVDVDDTLVLWGNEYKKTVSMWEPILGEVMLIAPHWPNIRLVKEKSARGATVVVWSQGGYKYAAAVVKALGLEKYVDMVMTKPTGIIDDLHASAWMPTNVCLPAEKNYKGVKV